MAPQREKAARTLAVIGARGGSKGLKDKNILDFAGKPLIQWTIEAALNATHLGDVIVSTDSDRIRAIALAAGARAPFLRPLELAGDRSDINDAIVHALEWLQTNENQDYDTVALLQPTQPLRTAALIDSIMEQYFRDADRMQDSLVTVTRACAKAAYLMHAENEFIQFTIRRLNTPANRQQMPAYYLPAGVLYLAPVVRYLSERSFYGDRTRFVEVDETAAIDIDTADDFEKALQAYQSRLQSGHLD